MIDEIDPEIPPLEPVPLDPGPDSPARVVETLLRASLAAGASRVAVSIRDGGRSEIRVADDASGMSRSDALAAFGDGGGPVAEALRAAAAGARLEIETADATGQGTRLLVDEGRVVQTSPFARERGTTVVAHCRHFNSAAYRRIARLSVADTRAVVAVVISFALATPQVAFSLESNGRELITVPPAALLIERIAAIWGDEFARGLLPVAGGPAGAVTGFVQRPDADEPAGRRVFIFVGGRRTPDRTILGAARRGYGTAVPPGSRPSLFLFVDPAALGGMDAAAVVEAAVAEAIRAASPEERASLEEADASSPAPEQMSLFAAGAEPAAGERDELAPPDAPVRLARPTLWQVHARYILAETRGGVIIVDQRAAHERILYEEALESFGGRRGGAQRLLFPLIIPVSPAEHALAGELAGLLAGVGFEMQSADAHSIAVLAAPNPHPYFDAERCIRRMLSDLAAGTPLLDAARTQHQRIALSFATNAAIQPGQRLSQQEMGELFDRLFATEEPYRDLHGRATIVQLALAELEEWFAR